MINTLITKNRVKPLLPGICLAIAMVIFVCPAVAQEKKGDPYEKSLGNALTFPVRLYKKYASGADGARCPMYPSCSTYAVDAFHKHGMIMGWIMTCDRLMRCGRDEIRLTEPVKIGQKRLRPDPVDNNDFWWD